MTASAHSAAMIFQLVSGATLERRGSFDQAHAEPLSNPPLIAESQLNF
jgi:hypothetical protein